MSIKRAITSVLSVIKFVVYLTLSVLIYSIYGMIQDKLKKEIKYWR